MISFPSPPPIGTVLMLDEQAYELASVRRHVRKDGRPTSLLVWQTQCPSCGGEFEQITGLVAKGVNRRCTGCKRIGRPVKGKRGRKVNVTVNLP